MKQGFFAIFLTLFLSSATLISAQTPQEPSTRTIIVQTDLEEAIPNHQITCREIPKKLDFVSESEVQLRDLTTSESGEALLQSANENVIYSCSSKETTTTDHCWHFPTSTQFFEIYETAELNTPIYLVAQKSEETCNKEFTEAELASGIDHYLPSGTPAPFQNKHVTNNDPAPPTEEEVQEVETAVDSEFASFWNWILRILGSIL